MRLRQILRAALSAEPLDIVVHEAETRRKKILIADMDSTMIDQECIDELADEIGLKDRVAAITARSMNGEIAFEPALRERVALMKNLDVAVVDRIIRNRLTLRPEDAHWSRPCAVTAPGPHWFPAASTFSPRGSRTSSASTRTALTA